jgi:hypothetical protein
MVANRREQKLAQFKLNPKTRCTGILNLDHGPVVEIAEVPGAAF